MSEDKKDKRVPNLRFKGFTDDWMQRQIDEITTTYSGGTPSIQNAEYYGGSIPFIRSAEINANNTKLYLTKKGLKNSSAKIVDEGDILYALYGATSGEVGISKINGAINQAIMAIKPKISINTYFLYQQLQKNKEKIILKYLQGGQGNLSGKIIKDLKLNFPSTEEQEKIGRMIRTLDSMITLEQEKISMFKKIQQAILRKIYTQKNNSHVKQKKLGEFVSKKGRLNKENDEKYIVSSVNNKVGFTNQNQQFENTRLDTLDKSTYRIVEPTEYAYNPSRINVGSIGFNNTKNTLIVSPLYIVFSINDDINKQYFNYFTKTERFLYEVSRNTEGSVRQSLSYENLKNINISVPSDKKIQSFYAQYLSSLEKTIHTMEKKVEVYIQLKKKLLQNLFV